MVPVAERTKSRVPVRKWFLRGMIRREGLGHRGGWFFCQAGSRKRARMGDYDFAFKAYMAEVKRSYKGIIPEEVDPLEDMSLRRSGRRGANTVARVSGLPKDYIETHNRWRKRERAKGTTPKLDMLGTYTQVQEALALRLQYTQCQ